MRPINEIPKSHNPHRPETPPIDNAGGYRFFTIGTLPLGYQKKKKK